MMETLSLNFAKIERTYHSSDEDSSTLVHETHEDSFAFSETLDAGYEDFAVEAPTSEAGTDKNNLKQLGIALHNYDRASIDHAYVEQHNQSDWDFIG